MCAHRTGTILIQEAGAQLEPQLNQVALQCKAPPTGNKAWIPTWADWVVLVAARKCHPPPRLLRDYQSSGDSPLAASVSGLIEQDVSWFWVLGNVWSQSVELLDCLCINFLQEREADHWINDVADTSFVLKSLGVHTERLGERGQSTFVPGPFYETFGLLLKDFSFSFSL